METCDADANGSEKATVVVYTRNGRLCFCLHHFNKHKKAMRGYLAGGIGGSADLSAWEPEFAQVTA